MNEPATRPRQAIDLDEFERRLRTVAPVQKAEDPLAELARLVGQDDPFRTPFAEAGRARHERRQEPRLEMPTESRRDERAAATRQEPVFRQAPLASPAVEPAAWDTPHLRPGSAAFADLRRSVAAEVVAPPTDLDEAWGGADVTASRREPANESLVPPQAVAVVGDEDDPWLTDDAVLPPPPPPPAIAPKASRRGLYAGAGIGAVALLTLGILYAFKGNMLTASGEPPTIRAMNGPNKVPPPDAGAPEVADADTTVLDRNATPDKRQSTRVVSHEEQPVDLGHAQGGADEGKSGPVMEPKRVKTMVVRADGTIVGNDPVAAAAPAGGGAAAPAAGPAQAAAVPPMTIFPPLAAPSGPAEAAPQAKPATPKATARVATTPKTGATAIANAAATVPASVTKPRPVKPVVAAAKAPVDAADDAAPPDPTPTGTTGGGFAVQLAAPGSEQEARDVAARLQKKFATQLEGMKPTIRQADAGGRQVYRVRVGNLSREEAAALCDKLKAGGGACFIAKN